MWRRLIQLGVGGSVLMIAGQAHGHWVPTQAERDFYRAKRLAEIRAATQRYLDVKQAKADG